MPEDVQYKENKLALMLFHPTRGRVMTSRPVFPGPGQGEQARSPWNPGLETGAKNILRGLPVGYENEVRKIR